MHHAQIAQRAFNTPLMVDPAKALAFLSGLGPRITGQEITFHGLEAEAVDQTAATRVAWDNTAKNINVPGTGRFLVGIATEAAGSGTTSIAVRLDGVGTAAA